LSIFERKGICKALPQQNRSAQQNTQPRNLLISRTFDISSSKGIQDIWQVSDEQGEEGDSRTSYSYEDEIGTELAFSASSNLAATCSAVASSFTAAAASLFRPWHGKPIWPEAWSSGLLVAEVVDAHGKERISVVTVELPIPLARTKLASPPQPPSSASLSVSVRSGHGGEGGAEEDRGEGQKE
jgi:hypothetical protein